MSIDVQHLRKSFGSFVALDSISLTIRSGDLVGLLGPSGSGKTTLLRILAGLEVPDSGQILFKGQDAIALHPKDRGIGFVFQHYALFKHMTVWDNIAFALRMQKRPKEEIARKVNELINLVQLSGMARRYPHQLSGGQKQRVALARALASEPSVLLLDEPFGALDARVRNELRRWLRRLHDELHMTSIFVTHDQEEAFEVSDQVVVMNHGCIEQTGTPAEVFHHPANPFVARFLGETYVLRLTREDISVIRQQLRIPLPPTDLVGETVDAYIRPHEWEVHLAGYEGWSLPAQIVSMNLAGVLARIEAKDKQGVELDCLSPPEVVAALGLAPGAWVYLTPKAVHFFN